jgi:hypothetical protein
MGNGGHPRGLHRAGVQIGEAGGGRHGVLRGVSGAAALFPHWHHRLLCALTHQQIDGNGRTR